ncbi:YbaN family protein [Devosia sp. YIM 151766]|uniref:YbaN family protein n=1 Tax=Devosia sp. YIM 151766 TaxID=3017325 RepID=UPI00255C4E88|nr:YbaN family protein [Devosia sp. YIM 151766]WIY53633.1 YbaN family protein [Devosia sp. YIM 151766]
MLRPIYLMAGLVMLALGIIGAFLPLMPTTIFLIMATWFFARSSPRLENWLLNHRRFGPVIRDWRDSGAISPRSKVLACSGIALGIVFFWIGAKPGYWLWLAGSAFMGGSAAFVLSRPNAGTARRVRAE